MVGLIQISGSSILEECQEFHGHLFSFLIVENAKAVLDVLHKLGDSWGDSGSVSEMTVGVLSAIGEVTGFGEEAWQRSMRLRRLRLGFI